METPQPTHISVTALYAALPACFGSAVNQSKNVFTMRSNIETHPTDIRDGTRITEACVDLAVMTIGNM